MNQRRLQAIFVSASGSPAGEVRGNLAALSTAAQAVDEAALAMRLLEGTPHTAVEVTLALGAEDGEPQLTVEALRSALVVRKRFALNSRRGLAPLDLAKEFVGALVACLSTLSDVGVPADRLEKVADRARQAKLLVVEVDQADEDDANVDEPFFWRVIDALDWRMQGDDDAVLSPAAVMLSSLSAERQADFEVMLEEKVDEILDSDAIHVIARKLDYTDENLARQSDAARDIALSAIAQGQAAFERLRHKPEEIDAEVEFEALGRLPDMASAFAGS